MRGGALLIKHELQIGTIWCRKKSAENSSGCLEQEAAQGRFDFTCKILLESNIVFCLYYRYVVGQDRVLFVLKDGSKAWEIKDYLVSQERCKLVTIEGKDYFGAGHEEYEETVSIFSCLRLLLKNRKYFAFGFCLRCIVRNTL